MNQSFMLLDKSNNLQRAASVVVRFNYEEKDYLVYSVEESAQNSQIFVSKLVLNSEGKYFVDNLLPEEKGKLNNIVYNIVILVPTEAQKGVAFESLISTYFDKISVKLSCDIPDLSTQEYYGNCSVAITSKILVDAAVKLYNENLIKAVETVALEVPTWTSPTEVISPIPAGVHELSASEPVLQESVVASNLDLQSNSVQEPVVSDSTVVNPSVEGVSSVSESSDISVNNSVISSQVDKLAVVSDPSLGIGVQQPNIGKLKKAGFANNKYIIIGTVCLLLAVAVVITAYFLIKNMG